MTTKYSKHFCFSTKLEKMIFPIYFSTVPSRSITQKFVRTYTLKVLVSHNQRLYSCIQAQHYGKWAGIRMHHAQRNGMLMVHHHRKVSHEPIHYLLVLLDLRKKEKNVCESIWSIFTIQCTRAEKFWASSNYKELVASSIGSAM